jgi:O-acetyl-ADP-ribose deacetylase (regulator of RNase III)
MQINKTTVEVVKGSVTHQKVDAIVNAANKWLADGTGITGAIFKEAGPKELAAEIEQKYPNGTPTGTAVITDGFLLGKKIIHTPGPKWGEEGGKEAELLAACYRSCMEVADANELTSLAFCSISTGIYGYPLAQAAPLAMQTVRDYLNTHPDTSIRRVVFAMWGEEEFGAFTKALEAL